MHNRLMSNSSSIFLRYNEKEFLDCFFPFFIFKVRNLTYDITVTFLLCSFFFFAKIEIEFSLQNTMFDVCRP